MLHPIIILQVYAYDYTNNTTYVLQCKAYKYITCIYDWQELQYYSILKVVIVYNITFF